MISTLVKTSGTTSLTMFRLQLETIDAALSGKREDIPKVLAEHVEKIHRAATGN